MRRKGKVVAASVDGGRTVTGVIREVTFVVEGAPVPKGRPIFSRWSKHARTPDATRAYEERVRLRALEATGRARWTIGPNDVVAMTLVVSREHLLAGGDLDNIAKAVKDACNGVLYKDDCRVVSLTARLTKGEPFVCVTAAAMHRKDWQ